MSLCVREGAKVEWCRGYRTHRARIALLEKRGARRRVSLSESRLLQTGGSVGDGVHRRPGVEQPERKVDGGMTDRCESSILISVALVGIVGGSSLGRPVHI